MKIRIMIASRPSNETIEEVYFTTDFQTQSLDFFPNGYQINNDSVITVENFPMGFPMESTLIKQ